MAQCAAAKWSLVRTAQGVPLSHHYSLSGSSLPQLLLTRKQGWQAFEQGRVAPPGRSLRMVPRAMGKKKEKKAKGPGSKSKSSESASEEEPDMKPQALTGPPYQDPDIFLHSLLLIDSYKRATGRDMFSEPFELEDAAKKVWEAPFACLSCDTSSEAIYDYGNKAALDLFEHDWAGLTSMSSKASAASSAEEQATRDALMKDCDEKGFVDFADAVRYTSSGRPFVIKKATLWTIKDVNGEKVGQAAILFDVEFEEPEKRSSDSSRELEHVSNTSFTAAPPQRSHDASF